jgi:hypothetical protein
MKSFVILISIGILCGFVSAVPILSISSNPTAGSVGSNYNVTITNNAKIVLNGLTVYFGSSPAIAATSSGNCKYSPSGITLGAGGTVTCTFVVPQLPAGPYDIIVDSKGQFRQRSVKQFIINPNYEGHLAKIKVGTKIPDQYGAIIGDGKYQIYVVSPDSKSVICTKDELGSERINYEAVVTIKEGKISSVSRGSVADSNMEICISDKAIDEMEKSNEPETTLLQELETADIRYRINDGIMNVKIALMRFISSLLGGEYAKIAKVLSYA